MCQGGRHHSLLYNSALFQKIPGLCLFLALVLGIIITELPCFYLFNFVLKLLVRFPTCPLGFYTFMPQTQEVSVTLQRPFV